MLNNLGYCACCLPSHIWPFSVLASQFVCDAFKWKDNKAEREATVLTVEGVVFFFFLTCSLLFGRQIWILLWSLWFITLCRWRWFLTNNPGGNRILLWVNRRIAGRGTGTFLLISHVSHLWKDAIFDDCQGKLFFYWYVLRVSICVPKKQQLRDSVVK